MQNLSKFQKNESNAGTNGFYTIGIAVEVYMSGATDKNHNSLNNHEHKFVLSLVIAQIDTQRWTSQESCNLRDKHNA